MNRSAVLWVLSFIITLASAVYQRMTGPTYPDSGTVSIGNTTAHYRLLRSHETGSDAPVDIAIPESSVVGRMEWKRFKTGDPWHSVPMRRDNGVLSAQLPQQPAAGKLEYRVILSADGQDHVVPDQGGVVLRFKGEVPSAVLIIHVLAMFGGMLLSTRAGLEWFHQTPRFRPLILATIVLLGVGGIVLGPIVQKYAFDAYWTGWPFGHDLTDNKTIFALLCWVAALVAMKKSRSPRAWALGAAIVTFLVFMIPHSVLGSELDYNKLDTQSPASSTSTELPGNRT
ncbi:MAG: hypothetical protein WB699_14230 [Bacteroidota bacterium]